MQPFSTSLSFLINLAAMKSIYNHFVLLILIFSSCQPSSLDPGPVITESRSIQSYTSLSVYGKIDLIFTSDTSYQVLLEGPEQVLPHITTTVTNNRLKIEENPDHHFFHENVKVYISQNFFDEIYISGKGTVSGQGINVNDAEIKHYGSGNVQLGMNGNRLDVNVMGSGNVILNGAMNNLNIEITASGDVDAENLNTIRTDILVNGSGDSRVTASDSLDIRINGNGDVYYWGNPAWLQTVVYGSGTITDMQ
jgi:hypothetical protein